MLLEIFDKNYILKIQKSINHIYHEVYNPEMCVQIKKTSLLFK